MSKNKFLVVFFMAFVGLYACHKEEAVTVTSPVTTPNERPNPFANIKTPADNPITLIRLVL